MMKKILLSILITVNFTWGLYAADTHPRIWVTPADTAQIWYNIRNYDWAASLYIQLLNRIDAAVAIHKADPEYFTSRIPRTWGNCPNYTGISGGSVSEPPVYSSSELASKPTLHRVVDIYPPRSDNGNTISSVAFDDIPPFNDHDLFGMNCRISDGTYEFASYLGRELRNIHTSYMELGVDCGIAYYLTGNDDYAQLAADILSGYTEALGPMIPGPDPAHGGIVFPWYHMKGTRVMQRLPLIYDFVYPFISDPSNTVYEPVSPGVGNRKAFNFDASDQYFINEVNAIIERGLRGKNNFPVWESELGYYCVMSLTDTTVQKNLFNALFAQDAERQASTLLLLDHFADGIWPESLSYSYGVNEVMLRILNILDRWKPELNVIQNNKELLNGALKFASFEFPNGQFIRFGDSGRGVDLRWYYTEALATAKRKAYTMEEEKIGKLLKAENQKAGGRDNTWNSIGIQYTAPLKLLWGVDVGSYASEAIDYQVTSIASGQGVVSQRNYFSDDILQNGLMCFTGGAAYIHGHATGIDMELYGQGFVMGVEGGQDNDRSSDLHTNYLRVYAGHNTVIVNGTSRGEGGWGDIAQDKTRTVALEPLDGEEPISETFSFTRQFLDDNINNCDQQRTVSIIRTSPATGYYLDVFRSVSNETNNFHDYIYHNIGDDLRLTNSTGEDLETTANTGYYSTDIGDVFQQPGWKYFESVETSAPVSEPVKARFDLTTDNKYMHAFIPEGKELEISRALGPPTVGAPSSYRNVKTPVLLIRKNGEAWNNPFMVVYEPTAGETPSVKSVHPIYAREKVVGAEVRSVAPFTAVTDYIISMDNDGETLELPAVNIRFEGQFGIVRTENRGGKERVTLYIGEGKSMIYGTDTLIANDKLQGLKIIGELDPVIAKTGTEKKIEIEAEDYDEGGEGIAYHDFDEGNSGGAYRDDDVDIIADPAASNGHAVTQFKGADWMKYTFESDSSCNYEMNYIAACRNSDVANVNFYLNDSLLFGGPVPVKRTFDWSAYESNIMPDSVYLEKGIHVLKIAQGASLSNNPDKVVFQNGKDSIINDTTTNVRPHENPHSGYFLSDIVELHVTSVNGTVTISPEQEEYLTGTEVILEAIPHGGYQFDGWSGDVTAADNPLTIIMDASMQLTANFTAIPTYAITITAENGSVTRDPDSSSYNEGTRVTLMAYPDEGYLFENWSGDLDETVNPVTVVMDGNKNVTANFVFETGLYQGGYSPDVRVYPNPSKGIFTVSVPSSLAGGSYTVYSLSGIPVKEGPVSSQFDIDMDTFQPGIYILKLSTGSEVVWQKTVLNNK